RPREVRGGDRDVRSRRDVEGRALSRRQAGPGTDARRVVLARSRGRPDREPPCDPERSPVDRRRVRSEVRESSMLALVLALLAQHVTVTPDVIRIPAGQHALDVWPKFEKDPSCGTTTLVVTYVVPAGGIVPGGSVAFGLGYLAADDATNPA